MAKFILTVDVPESQDRKTEVFWIKQALDLAKQDIGAQAGNKHGGPHPITVPANRPGDDRPKIAEWTYEPTAADACAVATNNMATL